MLIKLISDYFYKFRGMAKKQLIEQAVLQNDKPQLIPNKRIIRIASKLQICLTIEDMHPLLRYGN